MDQQFFHRFQKLGKRGWLNLALAGILTLYIIYLMIALLGSNLCENLAVDYCAYWSGGRIINEHRMADVYDLELLSQYQAELYPQASEPNFETLAIMYLPAFILPFKYLSWLALPYSFLVWTLFNLVGFMWYVGFFWKDVHGTRIPVKILLLVAVCFPVFQNLYFGQASIVLGIFVGEMLRALLSDRPVRAGLWLGGLLLKPQLLVLIVPFLLIRRWWKVLAGFFVSAAVIGLSSLALIGPGGVYNLAHILLNAGGGGVHSVQQIMMNWRMLGWHLESVTGPAVGWGVIILGSVLTAAISLVVFGRSKLERSAEIALALLGVLAATAAVTWHAHFHMAIILIPPLLLLAVKDQQGSKIFHVWVLVPVLVHLVLAILAPVVTIGRPLLQLVEGLRGFGLNLLVLGWAVVRMREGKESVEGKVVGG